jgi:hypothetical protein
MLLSDILSRLEDDAEAAETLLGLGDLALMARLERAAAERGCALGEFAGAAVRRYAADASDEEWITLMGALGRADDPGAICLKRAFDFVLRQDAEQGKQNGCHCG